MLVREDYDGRFLSIKGKRLSGVSSQVFDDQDAHSSHNQRNLFHLHICLTVSLLQNFLWDSADAVMLLAAFFAFSIRSRE